MKSRKLVMIFSLVCYVALALALIFLPEYYQKMFIHGRYISHDENYIKLYTGKNAYQFVDIRELTDLPEMRAGDAIIVTYRKGSAFKLHDRNHLYQQQVKPIVATDLTVSVNWGAFAIKTTNITPTSLQLQIGVLDDRLTGLAISTAFRLERKTARGWDYVSEWGTANKLTDPEEISFQDGDYIEFNWENICGELQPGTYRIHVRIYCDDSSRQCSAAFTIE